MKSERNDFLINTNFLTTTTICLLFFGKKMFALMNTWIIGKNSIEEDFYSHLNMEDITDANY